MHDRTSGRDKSVYPLARSSFAAPRIGVSVTDTSYTYLSVIRCCWYTGQVGLQVPMRLLLESKVQYMLQRSKWDTFRPACPEQLRQKINYASSNGLPR